MHRKPGHEGSSSSDEGEEEDWHSVYDGAYFDDYEVTEEPEAVDTEGWERGRSSAGGGSRETHRPSRSQSRERDLNDSSGGGGDRGRGYSGGGAGSGGRDDEDDHRRDDRNGRRTKASYSASDTEESDTDDEQAPVPSIPHHVDTRLRSARAATTVPPPQADSANTDDDDVPLARSIPTALKAQRTIRRQVRDENDERRRQRSLRYKERQQSEDPEPPVPVTHASPPRLQRQASRSPMPTVRTNIGAQELVAPAPVARTRPRAKTLTTSKPNPFSADDLAMRLQAAQVSGVPTTSSSRRPSGEALGRGPAANEFGARTAPFADERIPQERSLRPMRSFHRTRVTETVASLPAPAIAPTTASNYRVGRSNTTATPATRHHEDPHAGKPASLPTRTFAEQGPQRSRSVRRGPSDELNRGSSRQPPAAVPDVPPVPTPVTSTFQVVSRAEKTQMWQQRVFVFNMQTFYMVEIGPGSTARHVLGMLEQQGRLGNWAGAGGWMLFEISQDFGMERPLRGFEIVGDVVKSWDKDRTVNVLLAKKTPMASTLHPSAIPTSSPRCGGYIEYEAKRGSWKKRWLELREQGLWLAKKNTGKDETFLCSLSNFDAYVVTRVHKSPKPFVFAVKSTDNLTFFENASDYVHTFSCGEKDGHNWIEKIMVARSYVINQERNVISSLGQTASVAGTTSLSRAATRKGPRMGPPQPFLSAVTAAPAILPDRDNVFEPGSLLSKR
ncbi:hypothetical protein OF83DRAFT_1050149 [Amylostereum chailletii]|nr:hypothetical protein OF83DRAFT_1050149 [Amylostereum chailletii]